MATKSTEEVPAAKTPAPENQPDTFPKNLIDYLAELNDGRTETKSAFKRCMQAEGDTGKKEVAEWDRLYKLFRQKPTGVAWATWKARG